MYARLCPFLIILPVLPPADKCTREQQTCRKCAYLLMHPKAVTGAVMQGGIQLLVSLLNDDAAHLEAALWALQSVICAHPSNQAAAVQAGALPKLVGLLDFGPDTSVAEYAADCLYFLAQVPLYAAPACEHVTCYPQL